MACTYVHMDENYSFNTKQHPMGKKPKTKTKQKQKQLITGLKHLRFEKVNLSFTRQFLTKITIEAAMAERGMTLKA